MKIADLITELYHTTRHDAMSIIEIYNRALSLLLAAEMTPGCPQVPRTIEIGPIRLHINWEDGKPSIALSISNSIKLDPSIRKWLRSQKRGGRPKANLSRPRVQVRRRVRQAIEEIADSKNE